jgi:hypothetical protein
MADQDGPIRAPRFNDPRRERIHRRLLLVGAGPAAFYRDVVRIMSEGAVLETTVHLVAHLLREIEGGIRKVLLPRGYEAAKDSEKKHREEIDAILKAYGVGESDAVAVAWRRLADQEEEMRLARLAHRNALGEPRQADEEFRSFVLEVEGVLDVLLERFETRYLEPFRMLDELLAKPEPGAKDVETLRNRVPNSVVTLEYFLSKPEAERWFEPLARSGFFEHPPAPLRADEEEGTRFPVWPGSRYLARMAAKPERQARVAEIALGIPDTGNINVQEDLIDVVLALPPYLARRLVSRIAAWVKRPHGWLRGDKLGQLVSQLARGQEVEAACELARVVLAVEPDPRGPIQLKLGETERTMAREPRTAYDLWQYEEILKTHIPDLVDAAGLRGLEELSRVLESLIRLSRSSSDDEGPQDYSYIWRPAIEDHAQNHPHSLKDALVTAVRDAAERLARQDASRVPEIVEALQVHPWLVFRRIVLHLLRLFPDTAAGLVAERLTDRDVFEEHGLWHEYILLACQELPRLPTEGQERIWGWIDAGPDLERYKETAEKRTGTRPTREEAAHFRRAWKFRRLAALEGVLPPEWQRRHAELASEFGEAEHPEFVSYSGGIVRGPTSPKAADEFRGMGVEEIAAFLKTWQPTGDFLGPSPEGLGRELTAAVASDPARFVTNASRFQGLEPTYVRALLQGLREALGHERVFSWAPVLELCGLVLAQPANAADESRQRIDDRDPGWSWTRKAIADLLERGLQPGPVMIPFALREAVWRVMHTLTEDAEPTPEYEREYGGSNMNPAELSINTTRGEAMHAAVRYGLWVRTHLEKEPCGRERIARGFDEVPELREVLERHLDPERDPSLAVRSVYGQWFPWLALLDRRWAAANLSKVFPWEEELSTFRDAAWHTYVVFCRPFDDAFQVLRDEYRRAIERLGSSQAKGGTPADPERRLAEHLMVFYWRGKLEFDSPELERFYARASDPVRAHAIWFIGSVFRGEKEPPPEEMLRRLATLWERRLLETRREPRLHAKELGAFGDWFISEVFEDAWAVSQLLEVLRLTGRAEPDHLIMERLVKLTPAMPGRVVECVRRMIEGADEGWKVYGWRDQIRSIIGSAIRSDEVLVREAAAAVVHLLAARGHLEFKDLLAEG